MGNDGNDDFLVACSDESRCNDGFDLVHDHSQAERDEIMSESDCKSLNPAP